MGRSMGCRRGERGRERESYNARKMASAVATCYVIFGSGREEGREGRDGWILILCTRLLEFVTLITLIASFLPWHASLIYVRKITLL